MPSNCRANWARSMTSQRRDGSVATRSGVHLWGNGPGFLRLSLRLLGFHHLFQGGHGHGGIGAGMGSSNGVWGSLYVGVCRVLLDTASLALSNCIQHNPAAHSLSSLGSPKPKEGHQKTHILMCPLRFGAVFNIDSNFAAFLSADCCCLPFYYVFIQASTVTFLFYCVIILFTLSAT